MSSFSLVILAQYKHLHLMTEINRMSFSIRYIKMHFKMKPPHGVQLRELESA